VVGVSLFATFFDLLPGLLLEHRHLTAELVEIFLGPVLSVPEILQATPDLAKALTVLLDEGLERLFHRCHAPFDGIHAHDVEV
jgi:hypothetical protein